MKLRPKLTYANVVSTCCLFLLIGGGTAFAATQLGQNSVGTKQLKNGAVTAPKLAKSAQALVGTSGAKGEQGPPGAPGAPGAPATTLVAQIRSDGTVNSSTSPITVVHSSPNYVVNFGRNISHCAAFVTPGGVPNFSSGDHVFSGNHGYTPEVNIYSPDPANEEPVTGFPLSQSAYVSPYSGTTPSDGSFYIAVLC